MPRACYGNNSSPYVARHNPALYYPSISATVCEANDRPMPSPVPNPGRSFTWITPDLEHDLDTGTLADASSWLQTLLAGSTGLLTSKSYTAGNTAIFIWFDSAAATDSASTLIPLIVIAPSVGHRIVSTPLNDYYLLHGWRGCSGSPASATGARSAASTKHFDSKTTTRHHGPRRDGRYLHDQI
jgi:hypothetical protein